MKKSLCAVAAVVLFFVPTRSVAWDSKAHMTVAEIAWQNLDEEKRTAVSIILAKHPHKTAGLFFVDAQTPADIDKDERNFLLAATWPDWVRPAQSGPPKPK